MLRPMIIVTGSLVAIALLAASPPPPPDTGIVPQTDEEQETNDDAEGGDGKHQKKKALTLKRIFPEKPFFGPSVRQAAFSKDGRWCAFLYRPYIERRHGNDLYLLDTHTGRVCRFTCVSRMAEFQADTREVRDDREKKAKKAGIKIDSLLREQAERLGWLDSPLAGEFEGAASGRFDAIAPGDCSLSLLHAVDGSFSGTLRIGLVRLMLAKGAVDDDGALTFKVTDDGLDGEATLELRHGKEKLAGGLSMGDPKQTLRLSLSRVEKGDNGDDESGPRGVMAALGERLSLGDVVLADDATINDEKEGKKPKKQAPRYGGVSSMEWSPTRSEMLLLSLGEIYRLSIDIEAWETPIERPEPDEEVVEDDGASDEKVTKPEQAPVKEEVKKQTASAKPVVPYRGTLERLTRTRERERSVQYLPDGTGYTYLRGGALMKVSFDDPRLIQLDPELEDNERMVGYRISPDQTRLVFQATRGQSFFSSGRKVTIVNYRERFARTRTVTRHMSDDPFPEVHASIYLYDLSGHDREEGTLQKVFTRRVSGPRDVLRLPEWSPDSSRIAFAAFDQKTARLKILEAGFVETEQDEDEKKEQDDAEAGDETASTGNGDAPPDDEEETDGKKTDEEEEEPDFTIENAEVVYEFLHNGGPTTPRMVHPQYLPDSRRMVFLTELSGYRQLHLLDPRYERLTQLTEGQYEVYPFDISEDHERLFVSATKGDPNQEQVYVVDLPSGEMTRLTTREGSYSAHAVRDDGSMVVASFVDFASPRETYLIDPTVETPAEPITDSHPPIAHELTEAAPEYFAYENRHGQTIHGHMFKPADWTEADKRPLLIYVYGGPLGERKMATRGSFSAPGYFFARYMSEVHGWVTATVDPRGASGYGAKFEKANFEQVGKPQTEDLVDAAEWFVEHHGVDPESRALHGWSFGGFQTQMVMYTEPEVFAVGIAGAGPTEWHNYNSWYSTGTIGPSATGKTDLDKYSLLPLAKNLEGKLLLVHGVEDSNVLYQDTVRVYRELLKADKETLVELFIDPTGGHGLGGDVKTINRYRKYEDFLLRHLGKGTPHEEASEVQATDEDASE